MTEPDWTKYTQPVDNVEEHRAYARAYLDLAGPAALTSAVNAIMSSPIESVRRHLAGTLTPQASVGHHLPQAEYEALCARMGVPVEKPNMRLNGTTLEMSAMTPEQARAWLAENPK